VHKVLGKDYAGTLVSDGLATYDVPTRREHKCIAHHLRAIEAARELSKTRDPTYFDSCKQSIPSCRRRSSRSDAASCIEVSRTNNVFSFPGCAGAPALGDRM
jgi:hypothetical protein